VQSRKRCKCWWSAVNLFKVLVKESRVIANCKETSRSEQRGDGITKCWVRLDEEKSTIVVINSKRLATCGSCKWSEAFFESTLRVNKEALREKEQIWVGH